MIVKEAPLLGDDSCSFLVEYANNSNKGFWELVLYEIIDKSEKIFFPRGMARYFACYDECYCMVDFSI